MAMPVPVKTWLFSNNNSITFVSLNDTMSKLLFGVKNFLVGTVGYTVKYTCDGTTGPTSSSDHTDRWATAANAATRGATTGTAQSFAVLTDAQGCDVLLAYQGASDDVANISFSPGGLYTPAATSNQQPTATDALLVVNASIIVSTASGNRVWSCQASNDKKMFRAHVFRANALTWMWGVEQVTSVVGPNTVFSPQVAGRAANGSYSSILVSGGSVGTSSSGNGYATRLNGTSCIGGGNGEVPAGGFNVAQPQLQNAALVVPVGLCSLTAQCTGKVGNCIDRWAPWLTTMAQGDTMGSQTFILVASDLLPWDGSTPVTA